MTRRTWLIGGMASAISAACTAAAKGAAPPQFLRYQEAFGARRLNLRHAATGARFSGVYHNGTAPDPAALAELSVVLADHRTGTVRPFVASALDILWDVARRAGFTEEVVVLSGYRTPQTNTLVDGAGDSQHLIAAALDVQLSSARLAGFAETALGLARGGVGVYARHGFVHLDSGRVRRWGDTVMAAGAARAPADPLARMAEAWAATRSPRP